MSEKLIRSFLLLLKYPVTMCVVLFLILVTLLQEANCISSTTLNQRERINILRYEIKKEIRNVAGDVLQDSSQEVLDYVQLQNLPITPIMKVKKENNKGFEVLKTTTVKTLKKDKNVKVKLGKDIKSVKNDTKPLLSNMMQNDVRNSSGLRSKTKNRKRKIKKNHIRKPIEIFYRRVYNKDFINEPLEWIHCQDMVTPFLMGTKTDITVPKRLMVKDTTVQRVLQLLKVNTTSYGRDDIYSILYQLSNLQLRLFQWDVVPLNMLLNIIIKEHRHTLGYLKMGIRDLFRNWRMDITNVTNLLKQARIFRPPCIQISKSDGSTKSPKVTKYTKKNEATTCDDDDDCAD